MSTVDLHFKVFGHGPPVIILHGLFGTLDNWQTIGKRLSDNFTVFLVDQRNHGRSPHTQEMNYAAMAADLHALMEKQWVYKAHILGHSMGGKAAMEFALTHPGFVQKLVVVDMAPARYPRKHDDIFEALAAIDFSVLKERGEIEAALRKKIPDESVLQFLMKNVKRNKGTNSLGWKMNLPVLQENYGKILDAVGHDTPFEGPALFLRGGRSDYVLPEHQPQIESLFPNARIHTIEGAAHWLHSEAPDRFFDALVSFLDADR